MAAARGADGGRGRGRDRGVHGGRQRGRRCRRGCCGRRPQRSRAEAKVAACKWAAASAIAATAAEISGRHGGRGRGRHGVAAEVAKSIFVTAVLAAPFRPAEKGGAMPATSFLVA